MGLKNNIVPHKGIAMSGAPFPRCVLKSGSQESVSRYLQTAKMVSMADLYEDHRISYAPDSEYVSPTPVSFFLSWIWMAESDVANRNMRRWK